MFSTWTIQPAPLHRLLGQELRPIEQRLLGLMGFLRRLHGHQAQNRGPPLLGNDPGAPDAEVEPLDAVAAAHSDIETRVPPA